METDFWCVESISPSFLLCALESSTLPLIPLKSEEEEEKEATGDAAAA